MGSSACEPSVGSSVSALSLTRPHQLVNAMTLLCGRWEERQPLAAQKADWMHGVSGYGKLSRREKEPHSLAALKKGWVHGASCHLVIKGHKDRQPLAAQQADLKLAQGTSFHQTLFQRDQERQLLTAPTAALMREECDHHAKNKLGRRGPSISEFPSNLQRDHSWLLRLLALLASLVFSMQWLSWSPLALPCLAWLVARQWLFAPARGLSWLSWGGGG